MKFKSLLVAAVLAAAMISCKKHNDKPPHQTPTERTVSYVLYTSKNYGDNNTLVTIKLRMLAGTTPIWDSVLAPIALKNMPGPGNKLVIEKKVPGNNNAELSTGFYYNIENVGDSWYYEKFPAGEPLKTISLNF